MQSQQFENIFTQLKQEFAKLENKLDADSDGIEELTSCKLLLNQLDSLITSDNTSINTGDHSEDHTNIIINTVADDTVELQTRYVAPHICNIQYI